MEKYKFCRDCKHYEAPDTCNHPKNDYKLINFVTGEISVSRRFGCQRLREPTVSERMLHPLEENIFTKDSKFHAEINVTLHCCQQGWWFEEKNRE